jgi:glycosyltransferase involved in cell wall biosynthesis
MENYNPSVSVVIPTLNEEGNLPELLKDLESQTLKPLEIIVIDGQSDDATYHLAKNHFLVRAYSHKRGVGRQRTLGGFLARGEFIFFLDADVRLGKEFVEAVVRKMEKNQLDVACPWYRPAPGSVAIHLVYLTFNSIFFLGQKIFPSGAGSCIVVRKSMFEQTYGFDHTFKFDDIEFVRRASRKFRFGMLAKQVRVSDRRFREHGVGKMTVLYSLMSIFFLFGWFSPTNLVKYEFGKYITRNNQN